MIQEVSVVFSLKVTVFDPRKSSSHLLLLHDVLIYLFYRTTCNHTLLHAQYIWQLFLLQEYCYFRGILTALDLEWVVCVPGGHFSFLFKIPCFFQTSTCSHHPFQRNWLIWHTSYSHPFLERPLFYYKKVVVTIHSFEFTGDDDGSPSRRYHSYHSYDTVSSWLQSCIY